MKNKTIQRALNILGTLEANPQGLTAAELGEATGYPAGLVLDDLNEISGYSDFATHFALYTEEDGPGEAEDDELPFDAPAGDRIRDIHVRWFISVRDVPYPPLRLSRREAVALLWLFEEYPPPEKLGALWKSLKESILPAGEIAAAREAARSLHSRGGSSLKFGEHLAGLREALLKEKKVRLKYYAKNLDEVVSWVLCPLGLIFHSGNGAWYLVARRDETGETVACHVGRVRRVEICAEGFDYPEDFSLKSYLRHRWGMDLSPPEKVRVRFYNDASVVEKVLREFQLRGLPRPKALPGGHLEYRGEILGIHNFARWVLSFGSSAEVLEPAWLREDMIRIAREWDRLYNNGE